MPDQKVKADDKSLKDRAIAIERYDKKTGRNVAKYYVPVDARVVWFNDHYPDGEIYTEILTPLDAKRIIIKATIFPNGRANMTNPRLFVGHSQATWGEGMVNQTAALENAETSAVGRALGMMGIGVIDSIASPEEIDKAEEEREHQMNETVSRIVQENGALSPETHNQLAEALKKKGKKLSDYGITKETLTQSNAEVILKLLGENEIKDA